jgi:hypothetical protein
MSKTQILVIGRNEPILQTVVRLINNNPGWYATGAITNQEALKVFTTQPCQLVLLGGGISPHDEALLRANFTAQNPDIIIVQHYGGGSGLLTAEIYGALNSYT